MILLMIFYWENHEQILFSSSVRCAVCLHEYWTCCLNESNIANRSCVVCTERMLHQITFSENIFDFEKSARVPTYLLTTNSHWCTDCARINSILVLAAQKKMNQERYTPHAFHHVTHVPQHWWSNEMIQNTSSAYSISNANWASIINFRFLRNSGMPRRWNGCQVHEMEMEVHRWSTFRLNGALNRHRIYACCLSARRQCHNDTIRSCDDSMRDEIQKSGRITAHMAEMNVVRRSAGTHTTFNNILFRFNFNSIHVCVHRADSFRGK